jgi:hypothetical protein
MLSEISNLNNTSQFTICISYGGSPIPSQGNLWISLRAIAGRMEGTGLFVEMNLRYNQPLTGRAEL